MNVILEGTVGSTAYGLAREGSDIDTLGIWLEPTQTVLGLRWTPHKASKVQNHPDATYHELQKYISLALKCNPTLLELLWLDEYSKKTWVGQALIDYRAKFFFENGVRNAYMGYAWQQVEKLRRRGDSFDSDTKNRTAKHARHCMRLARQGAHLLSHGEIIVKVDNPEEYWAFDDMTPEQMLTKMDQELKKLEGTESVLPTVPDYDFMNNFLVDVRLNHL